ncbi:MAG: hypothetical protein ACOZIN_04960 [Myxococcota bacterium]
MRSIRAALWALPLALVACPGGRPVPKEDAGTIDFVGRSCNVDAECGSLRCDKVRHQCICLSDSSCAPTQPGDPVRYCNNYTGLCVTEISGCKSDLDCKDSAGEVDPTQYCDSSIRTCRPRKAFCEVCAADFECGGQGDLCLTDSTLNVMFCGKACALNADCARGATCQDFNGTKQCWPDLDGGGVSGPPSCRNFKGCTSDSLRTCNSNADCADLGDQRCDLAQGKCVAIDQVCPFGTVCDPRNKICVLECAVDADCGDPTLRCTNRVCEPIGECASDAQCPANKVCSIPPGQLTGQCQPFCQTDQDCPLGNTCQRLGDKFRCAPGCNSNANCPIDQRCNTTTKTCEGPVVGAVRTCQATVACNTCELCDLTQFACFAAKGTFPFCVQCSSSTECAGGACVQMADGKSYCAKYCVTGQECPQGFACLPTAAADGGQGQSVCVPANRQCANKCP